jgi:anti-sigma factor RsiW
VSAWPPPAPPEHPGELLSAYLDDELTAQERAEVEAHLEFCAPCLGDLDEEREVRSAVRGLPAVDPPFGFYERILRDGPADPAQPTKRRFRFGMANLVATAAAWVLVLGVANLNSSGGGSVNPSPNDYVAAHASVLPAVGGRSPSKEEAQRYDVPDRLAGTYELVGEITTRGIPQLIYTDGQKLLSVFVQAGRLNQAAVPDDARRVEVNGAEAWLVPSDDGDTIFLQRPGVVVIIVGPSLDQAASDMATAGPKADGDESLLDHVRDAAEGLLETFGLQG